MSITLPDLPPQPPASASPDERWRWIEAAQRDAHVRATIQLAEVQEAARLVAVEQVEAARRMVELLEAPAPAPSPAPAADGGRALSVVSALMGETDKAPADVVASVQATLGAAETLLNPPT